MYLKSIKIQGFKSFANKMELDFHDGITAIVGPNGSGKSNIADAVRWVLGEQKVKQLRSSSMQDVIFAGTESRKPVSFAYVAITFDNADHALPLDYEEVTAARRVYRSGESEYLLNGTACRLRDIQELFYDTGIGKEGYSIIGQGQIDKILSGKPEERRELFDEAAGIVKYKRRKAAAVKDLEQEKLDLIRIQDILNELEKRVGPLKRQSEQARVYLQKKEELKKYDINSFLLKYDKAQEDLKAAGEDLRVAEEQMRQAGAAFTKASDSLNAAAEEARAADERFEELSEGRTRREVSIEKYEGQINVLNEQINAVRMSEGQYQERTAALDADIAARAASGREYAAQAKDLDDQKAQILKEKEEAQKQLLEKEIEVSELESAIEYAKGKILEIINRRAGLQAEYQRFDTLLEQSGIRKGELLEELSKKQDGSEDEALSQKEAEIAGYTSRILDLEDKRNKIKKQRQAQAASYEKLEKELEAVREKYHRESSRLEYLSNVAERYEGYGNSVRAVMAKKSSVTGIIGVVADIIRVDKRYETAIETALGSAIQNVVTDNEDTAKRMIAYLKENRSGRATFLPLNAVTAPRAQREREALKEEGALGMANELVSADERFKGVIAHLLGRTLVADDIDHAIAISKKYNRKLRIVTLEGELLTPGGAISGGAFKGKGALLGRTGEIKALKVSVQKLKETESGLKDRMEDIRTARELLKDDENELQDTLQREYIQQNSLKIEAEHLRQTRIDLDEASAAALSQIEDIEKLSLDAKEQKQRISDEIEASKALEEQISDQNKENEKQLSHLLEELSGMRNELSKITLSESSADQMIAFAEENMRRVAQEAAKLKAEKQSLMDDYAGSEERIRTKQQEIKDLEILMAGARDDLETISEETKECLDLREELSKRQDELLKKRDELSEEKNNIDLEIFRLDGKKEKLEAQSEEMVSYIWDEYALAPHAASKLRDVNLNSISAIDKKIKEVKDEIRALGNINVNAIEEYKEISGRYELLTGQCEDIKKSNEALEGVIKELDEGMRKQFLEKFSDIRLEFDRAFKELFGGGKADLELIEGEDVLESGIRIIAQPPGKKLQNMMQLSGGEKALTAIALLFAIQNLKPSPFCLLDEIEAALDDPNVGRFADYLHKLTKNTQFIIITHRRGTMNAADRLYGITMQEKGVSALVSVNLVESELDE